jgi:hypothetical protein
MPSWLLRIDCRKLSVFVLRRRMRTPLVCEVVLQSLVSALWSPRAILVPDRDGRFVGKVWQELFCLTQDRLAMSSSHHPQTDGKTERTNRTMEEMRHYVNYRQNGWDEVLPALEHAYNKSDKATTRQLQFELLYRHKPLEFKDF